MICMSNQNVYSKLIDHKYEFNIYNSIKPEIKYKKNFILFYLLSFFLLSYEKKQQISFPLILKRN